MSHYGNRYNNNNPNFQNRKRKTEDSHYDGTNSTPTFPISFFNYL
jgi:hypothetical protein